MSGMTITADAPHHSETDARTHYVYRLYDAADRLLYVGMTCDPGQRLREHKRSQPWWGEVHRHTLQETATRADAFFVEAGAILTEKPAYNRDIPSLDRYDVLRSRSTLADPLSPEDRISALEYQLREARREIHRLAGEDRQLERRLADVHRLEADNAELRDQLTKEQHAKEELLGAVERWQERCDAKDQTRVFVVEGPRRAAPAGQLEPTAAALAPQPKRSLLSRLLG